MSVGPINRTQGFAHSVPKMGVSLEDFFRFEHLDQRRYVNSGSGLEHLGNLIREHDQTKEIDGKLLIHHLCETSIVELHPFIVDCIERGPRPENPLLPGN